MQLMTRKDKIDSQFFQVKKIAKRLAKKTGVDLADVEDFVLKTEFFTVLLYSNNIDLFVADFLQYMDNLMGASTQSHHPRRLFPLDGIGYE